jgi:hypothetical protein
MGAEMALREMGSVTLDEALDYVALLAELRPAKAPRAAVRWHGRFETEAPMLTLPELALTLAALMALCQGDREATSSPTAGCVTASIARKARRWSSTRGSSRSSRSWPSPALQLTGNSHHEDLQQHLFRALGPAKPPRAAVRGTGR